MQLVLEVTEDCLFHNEESWKIATPLIMEVTDLAEMMYTSKVQSPQADPDTNNVDHY